MVKLWCLVFLLAAVAYNTHGFPAESRPEEEILPKDDVDIFGSGGSSRPVIAIPSMFSYDGVFKSINDMFDRMRQQMAYMLSFPSRFGPGEPGNSTSVTKIINGHKYTINETVYEKGNGDAEAFFKVRVVNIEPANEDGLPTPRTKDVEEIENSDENDVNKSFQKREQPFNRLESFDEVDQPINIDLSNDIYVNELAKDWKPNPESEWIADLSNDIRVNDIAAAQGWKPNPYAETFSEDDFKNKKGHKNTEWSIETLEDNKNEGEWDRESIEAEINKNGEIEVFEDIGHHATEIETFEPIVEMRRTDLSRDTIVNELLEDETPNPDAEILNASPQSRYFYAHSVQR